MTTPEPTPDQGVDLKALDKRWFGRKAPKWAIEDFCRLVLEIERLRRLRAENARTDEVIEAAREYGYNAHFSACKITVGRCNCGYAALAKALNRLDAAPGSPGQPAESSQ